MSDSEHIDIYVNGDGGLWSCSPSVSYQIPTDVFDYYMMIGGLNDKEDLDNLVGRLSSREVEFNEAAGVTDIWVGVGGNWSGLPSMHFQIPCDIFEHLQVKGTIEKRLGRLSCGDDLVQLIDQTRFEIEFGGPAFESKTDTPRSKPTDTEVKLCGHTCSISSVKQGCCACEDIRPVIEEGTYPSNVDGQGWANTAMRDAGYCPFCNNSL